jgi:CheY-like chemotaxis protein
MMNSLLLYNNNISPDFVQDFKDSIGETKLFSITNQTLAKEDYSFDSVASEFLKTLLDKKYEVIFIPINLSIDNYLEFSGLRIGYHIRLTNEFNNQETPIVFIARESAFEINKLSFLGAILSCPQIYMTDKLEIDVFKKQIEFIQSTSKANVLKGFLDRIHIKPSGNYTTHHSIANEWSIMRWFKTILKSEIIDYTPDEIESIESKINSNLYYKYLTCKFPINNVNGLTVEDLKLKFNGKILYIDDEKDKGWNELFCALFYDDLINKVEDYESFGSEFKELEKDEIINLSVNKAKDFDLVILDFRLTEDDFYESDPKKITGYKILEGIKAHNKGIQVVIFSATNKVWNLQALQDAGADGFIIKESPENSTDAKFTFESITNLIKTIDKCFSLKIKKELVELHKSILKNILVDDIDENPRYNFFLKGLLKQASVIEKSIVLIDFNHPISLDITFLSCYNFLEQFRDYYLIEGRDFRYYLGFEELPLNRITIQKKSPRILSNGEFIKNGRNDNPSWFQVMAGLFIDYFNLSSAPFNEVVDLHNMSTSRNRYIHEDKSSFTIGEIRIIMTLTELATRNLKE